MTWNTQAFYSVGNNRKGIMHICNILKVTVLMSLYIIALEKEVIYDVLL